MDPIIARCGYRCDLCAARSQDAKERRRLADGWRRIYGLQNCTADSVRCDGCLSDGRLVHPNCEVRSCCLDLGYENCAECEDFPCEKLHRLMTCRSQQQQQRPRVSKPSYQRCCRQFDSIPRLIKIRLALGLDEAGLNCPPEELEHPDSEIGEPTFL